MDEGVLTKVAYQERPERFEYRLTEKGLDLWPVMVTLMQFGDRYYAPDGPPIVLTHQRLRRHPRRAPHLHRLRRKASPPATSGRSKGPGAIVTPVTNAA